MCNVLGPLNCVNKLFKLAGTPLAISRCNTIIISKNYATSFPDYYQNPMFRRDDQAKLIESGEIAKYALIPVRPPAAYETCSLYHDPLVEKVINHVMEMGKKKMARNLVEKGFEVIKRTQIERYHLAKTQAEKDKIELDPKVILHKAVENSKPLLQLLPVRRGGIVYQVPGPITEQRSLFLAIKWLLEATNDKDRTVHFPEKFAWELLDAANNTGKVIKRKVDIHRQCEANRAYAHYRWQ